MIEAAASEPLEANHKQDVEVPEALMSPSALQAALAKQPPSWSPPVGPSYDAQTGVHMRKLDNGIRVNYKVRSSLLLLLLLLKTASDKACAHVPFSVPTCFARDPHVSLLLLLILRIGVPCRVAPRQHGPQGARWAHA